MKEAKVLIGVPTAEMARRADFYTNFNLIDKPLGTGITFSSGQSPARNRNLIIQGALGNEEFTHILFLDDDVIVPSNIITQLLKHDKDIVTGLYLMRAYPNRPIIFDDYKLDGSCKNTSLDFGMEGLVPIVNCGLGCVLIKMDIFRHMMKADPQPFDLLSGKPYPFVRLGEIEQDHWCDDIGFFNRVRDLGYQLYCDLDCHVGHFATVTITPHYQDGKWFTVYDSYGTGKMTIPQLNEDTKNMFQPV